MINVSDTKQMNFIFNFVERVYYERFNKNKIVAVTQKLDDKNYMTNVYKISDLSKLKLSELARTFSNIVSYSITTV